VLLVFVIKWVSDNVNSFILAFGKDLTLTGRTGVWESVVVMIKQQPWLGYGYNAFWTGWGGPATYVYNEVGFLVFYSHDGLLELWLQLGIVGVFIFFAILIVFFYKSIQYLKIEKGLIHMFPLLYISFLVLGNITESDVLARNSIYWVLFVTLFMQIAKASSVETNVTIHKRAQAIFMDKPFKIVNEGGC
jgi:exopolysaccharide production protein ExoQ